MSRVVRFTVSLEEELLEQLDSYLEEKGYTNRSQGIRNLVRGKFVQEEWERGDRLTVATVNLVYDHHNREILDRLAHAQHMSLNEIVSTVHVHLDHSRCLEVLILRGKASALRELGDRLIATRGVLHGTMSFSTTANELVSEGGRGARGRLPAHDHAHAHPHDHSHEPEPRARRAPRRRARAPRAHRPAKGER